MTAVAAPRPEYTHPDHPGIKVRESVDADGALVRTFSVRFRDATGKRPRRTFDELGDALDLQAKRRSDKRWRPEEFELSFADAYFAIDGVV